MDDDDGDEIHVEKMKINSGNVKTELCTYSECFLWSS